MKNKKRILILYHSGAGSTRTLAEIYYEKLSQYYPTDINTINLEYDYRKLIKYDFLILAFPTYHCDPSTSMLEFIKHMPTLAKNTSAFVFTTCGLYSGNAIRRFVKECRLKNISIGGHAVYRAPATDGALLLPSIRMMYKYEKNIASKIEEDISRIEEIMITGVNQIDKPSFKLYTVLNYPNKVLGKAIGHNFTVVRKDCINCKKCIRNCIRHCWQEEKEYPIYRKSNCEFCYRCIHHCPKEAIIISSRTNKKSKLNEKFYNELKKKLILKLEENKKHR